MAWEPQSIVVILSGVSGAFAALTAVLTAINVWRAGDAKEQLSEIHQVTNSGFSDLKRENTALLSALSSMTRDRIAEAEKARDVALTKVAALEQERTVRLAEAVPVPPTKTE